MFTGGKGMFVFTDLKFIDLSQRLHFSDLQQFCKSKTFFNAKVFRDSGYYYTVSKKKADLFLKCVCVDKKEEKKAVFHSAFLNI